MKVPKPNHKSTEKSFTFKLSTNLNTVFILKKLLK